MAPPLKGDEVKGSKNDVRLLFQYYALKEHAYRGSYVRILALSEKELITLDPSSGNITNRWRYQDIRDVCFSRSVNSNNKGDDEQNERFEIIVPAAGANIFQSTLSLSFSSPFRKHIVSSLNAFRLAVKSKALTGSVFQCEKISRVGDTRTCKLIIGESAICELDAGGNVLSKYRYVDIHSIAEISSTTSDTYGFAIFCAFSRPHAFLGDRDTNMKMIQQIQTRSERNGIYILVQEKTDIENFRKSQIKWRNRYLEASSTIIGQFNVLKVSLRYAKPRNRRLVITDRYIAELELEGYGEHDDKNKTDQISAKSTSVAVPISSLPLSAVHSITRDRESAKITIEFSFGAGRNTYECIDGCKSRDSLVAVLYDACLRYDKFSSRMASLLGTKIPGSIVAVPLGETVPVSMETQLVQRLCRQVNPYQRVFQARVEALSTRRKLENNFVANITPSDSHLQIMNFENVVSDLLILSVEVNSTCMEIMHPKVYLENWASILDACNNICNIIVAIYQPKASLNTQEYRNVCLLLHLLIRLLPSAKTSNRGEPTWSAANDIPALALMIGLILDLSEVADNDEVLLYYVLQILATSAVTTENKKTLFLPKILRSAFRIAKNTSKVNEDSLIGLAFAKFLDEILLDGYKTTPRDIITMTLTMLSESSDLVLNMVSSNILTVKEISAILMHFVAHFSQESNIQVKALRKGMLLKAFYDAVFASHIETRIINRYLVALWMNQNSFALEMLERVVPSGLFHALSFPPVSATELDALESIDRERMIDTNCGNISVSTIERTGESRLLAFIKEIKLRPRSSSNLSVAAGISLDIDSINDLCKEAKVVAENLNFSIFFHMMGEDHLLPDLIWNQNTRQQLRDSLEKELLELNSDNATSWNYCEFAVEYDKGELRNHLKVGDCYVSLLLGSKSGTAVTQIRNPKDLFLSLYHRFLREQTIGCSKRSSDDTDMVVQCLKAMRIVYDNHHEAIGLFKDTTFLVEFLKSAVVQCPNIHANVLLLLDSLSKTHLNLRLMLSRKYLEIFLSITSFIFFDDAENCRFCGTNNPDAAALNSTNDCCNYWGTDCNDQTLNNLEISLLGIRILRRLFNLIPAFDENGYKVVPPPTAKLILASRIQQIANLILSEKPQVADASSELLVEIYSNAVSVPGECLQSLLLVIFSYPLQNFSRICTFLKLIITNNSFARANLERLLPKNLVSVLYQVDSRTFAKLYVEGCETPTVIWTKEMRSHLIKVLNQYRCENDFHSYALRYYPDKSLSVSLPLVHYSALDNALLCGGLYLNVLCNLPHLNDWTISEPLLLFEQSLTMMEVARDNESHLKLLLRAQILLFTRYPTALKESQYLHIDILFSYIECNKDTVDETAILSLELLALVCQHTDITRSVFADTSRRNTFSHIVHLYCKQLQHNDTKPGIELAAAHVLHLYGVYPNEGVIDNVGDILCVLDNLLATRREFRELEVHILVYTFRIIECACAIPEAYVRLVRGGVLWLAIPFILDKVHTSKNEAEEQVELNSYPNSNNSNPDDQLRECAMRAVSSIGFIYCYCETRKATSDDVDVDLVPLLVSEDNGVKLTVMQEFKLLKLLLSELLERIFTPAIIKLMRVCKDQNTKCVDRGCEKTFEPVMKIISSHEDITYPNLIWNHEMREAILTFIAERNETFFEIENLRSFMAKDVNPNGLDEIFVKGVYLRIFNESVDTNEIDNLEEVVIAVLANIKGLIDNFHWTGFKATRRDMTLKIYVYFLYNVFQSREMGTVLENLVESYSSQIVVLFDLATQLLLYRKVAKDKGGPESNELDDVLHVVFSIIEAGLVNESFGTYVSKSPNLLFPLMDRIISNVTRCLSHRLNNCEDFMEEKETGNFEYLSDVLSLLGTIIKYPNSVIQVCSQKRVKDYIFIIMFRSEFAQLFGSDIDDGDGYIVSSKLISFLHRFTEDDAHRDVSNQVLGHFFPEPLISSLRVDDASSFLRTLESRNIVETPELIWGPTLRETLKTHLKNLFARKNTSEVQDQEICDTVFYKSLSNEPVFGGVYPRHYLCNVKYPLRSALSFFSKMLTFFEEKGTHELQYLEKSQVFIQCDDKSNDNGLADTMNMLVLVTSSLVCLLRYNPAFIVAHDDGEKNQIYKTITKLMVHHTKSILQMYAASVKSDPLHPLSNCCLRLVHAFSSNKLWVESLPEMDVCLPEQLLQCIIFKIGSSEKFVYSKYSHSRFIGYTDEEEEHHIGCRAICMEVLVGILQLSLNSNSNITSTYICRQILECRGVDIMVSLLAYLDSKLQNMKDAHAPGPVHTQNEYKMENWKVLKTMIVYMLKHLLKTNYCNRIEQIMLGQGDKFVTHWKNKYSLKTYSYDILSSAIVSDNSSVDLGLTEALDNANMCTPAVLSWATSAAIDKGIEVASSCIRIGFINSGLDFATLSDYCIKQAMSCHDTVRKDNEEEIQMQSAFMDMTEQLWDD